MSTIDRIRVRVAHDDPIAVAGLSTALCRYHDLDVDVLDDRSDAAPGGLRLPGRRSVDVVLADYANGVPLAMQAARESIAPGVPKIVILTAIDREWEIRSALARGVRGYLLVGCTLDELADGLRAVHRGARHLSPRAAARLAESISIEPLTAREEQVLRLVVEGLCNKAIGGRLGIAVGTVKSHLKSTFEKLHVRSRTQAVAVVERRGLLREHPQSEAGRAPHAAAVLMTRHAAAAHAANRAELAA